MQRVARIDVPYYVVPGNHDHPRIRRALADAGVEVLDPGVARVGGIRILGVGDPTFTADNRLPRHLSDAQVERAGGDLARRVIALKPDVVAVHSTRQMQAALGDFAVGLAGHTHRFDLRYEQGSVVLETGSAGATGVGALTESADLPYEMQLLQFEDGRLVAVDRLSFEGTEGAFRLERLLVDPARVAAYPDPDATPFERGPFAPLFRFSD